MSAIRSEAIPQVLAALARARFWGSVQIDYQNGEPVLLRKTETMKTLEFSQGNTHEHTER